jgi:uncharacterized protein (DUF885 family)
MRVARLILTAVIRIAKASLCHNNTRLTAAILSGQPIEILFSDLMVATPARLCDTHQYQGRPMLKILLRRFVLASVVLIGFSFGPAAQASVPAAGEVSALADEFYVARADFDPLNYATANGDSRYDDKLGLSISPTVRAAYFAHLHLLQRKLAIVPTASLDEGARLNRDILEFEIASSLGLEPYPEHLLPISQMDNVPSVLANYASGNGSQPLTTPLQYRAYLSRLEQLPRWVDQAIENMREGMRKRIVQPKAVTVAMIPQFERMLSATPESNIFYTPIQNLPQSISSADRRQLTAAYRELIANQLLPALLRLNKFLKDEYLPASRDSAGMGDLPNGGAWYLARIKNSTNLPLTPNAVHELGLKEVDRIKREFAELAPKLGYQGAPDKLPQWVFAQKKFKPFTSAGQVVDAYQRIYSQVSEQLPRFFNILPKAKLSIVLEPELTRATASDHYTPLAADGSHPGVFWPVVSDPKDYSAVGMVTLFMHEGVPGHHLHAALLKEIPLPDFRKFNTENLDTAAYTEGWALYCESLGTEFGFYRQPEAYFGYLNNEMLRAVRLVVDTGMHAQRWSREQAIAYTVDKLGYTEASAKNQIERYMAVPAQALAYKVGALKILELRERAKESLGARFSYAHFHDVIVGDGTLPLPIMEARVDEWVAKEANSRH